jgi:hypothetical protein
MYLLASLIVVGIGTAAGGGRRPGEKNHKFINEIIKRFSSNQLKTSSVV